MIPHVAEIWRHPIKAIGCEALSDVDLAVGRPLPLDRAFALLEVGGDETPGWRSCRNFLRGAKGPGLMAVKAHVVGDVLHLQHPDLADISLPLSEAAQDRLINWLRPIYPEDRQAPFALVRAPNEGMADVNYASVSIMNISSLNALSARAGRDLGSRRFRGNIWISDLPAWGEFDFVGKLLQIGSAILEAIEPITRCRATEGSPDTGKRDTPTLQLLQEATGRQEFGINARVIQAGRISIDSEVSVL